jgi:hypothetical protein
LSQLSTSPFAWSNSWNYCTCSDITFLLTSVFLTRLWAAEEQILHLFCISNANIFKFWKITEVSWRCLAHFIRLGKWQRSRKNKEQAFGTESLFSPSTPRKTANGEMGWRSTEWEGSQQTCCSMTFIIFAWSLYKKGRNSDEWTRDCTMIFYMLKRIKICFLKPEMEINVSKGF